MVYILLTIYLLCTVSGLTILKVSGESSSIAFSNNILNLKLTYTTIIGLLFYVISFVLWIVLIQRFNLSYIYPITTGLAYFLVIASSIFVLKESISSIQWAGLLFILVGVILMNIKQWKSCNSPFPFFCKMYNLSVFIESNYHLRNQLNGSFWFGR